MGYSGKVSGCAGKVRKGPEREGSPYTVHEKIFVRKIWLSLRTWISGVKVPGFGIVSHVERNLSERRE